MEFNLKNYKTTLSKELLKQAGKTIVRECDETEKGHFVAYVDEGNDTYDVLLTISAKDEIKEHTCDCKSEKNLCRHTVALIIHIAGNTSGSKGKQTTKIKTQKNKTDALLDEADEKDLKTG